MDHLESTEYLDIGHASIQSLARDIAVSAHTARERTLAAFRFVRDEIAFGFASDFYDMRASDVLKARIGFCNTKSTLLVALLRAVAIPARQVFVDIDAGILRGVVDPGTPFVDHTYTEIQLDDRWVALDSYIIDPPLMTAAKRRLAREGQTIGYGVHNRGSCDWNGQAPAFAQFVRDGDHPAGTTRTAAVYRDVGDFYAHAQSWNKLSFPMRFIMPLAFAVANRRLDNLRRE